ncbi:MAG: peptide ABC transporter permease [Gammaproteobacteria bacterium]|nr:MAG: peptide ABC transporter permease [Gammaproteobacteria bacterium]
MSESGRSLWQDAMRRLRSNRAAVISCWLLGAILLLALLGPSLSPYEYDQISWDEMAMAPSLSSGHWFGTDAVGRDLFVRTAIGARISLAVAFIATTVALLIGVIYGAISGYVGGRVDSAMMRFVDLMYSMPFMFFVIVLMVVFGRNIFLIFVAIGAVEWLTMARIVRGQTISLKNNEFIEATVAIGASPLRVVLRHIIPNVLGPVLVYMTLTIPGVIMTESFLSYLGLGVQEPLTSWGVLVSEGVDEMEAAPWMLLIPSLFLAATLFCFNFIGDGLRDALDPKVEQ